MRIDWTIFISLIVVVMIAGLLSANLASGSPHPPWQAPRLATQTARPKLEIPSGDSRLFTQLPTVGSLYPMATATQSPTNTLNPIPGGLNNE